MVSSSTFISLSPPFGKKGGRDFYFFFLYCSAGNRLEECLLFLCCFWIGKENELKGKNGSEACPKK
ncbi:hypothetical protein ES332_A10G142000v1 [Gossypium tomentosum]|uniref:Uncharacterized protein n=1 Tax=Gossypium tomentosum TaxID=34277 RepID=A0A5D2NPV1_GOSTO|nr:hypothetical protein ES332_A10G142000v1 [Gossypium tomentosum]